MRLRVSICVLVVKLPKNFPIFGGSNPERSHWWFLDGIKNLRRYSRYAKQGQTASTSGRPLLGFMNCGWTKSCTSCSLLVNINLQNMGQKWDKPFTISLLVHTFGMIASCSCWSIQRMLKKTSVNSPTETWYGPRNRLTSQQPSISFIHSNHSIHQFSNGPILSCCAQWWFSTHLPQQRTALRC